MKKTKARLRVRGRAFCLSLILRFAVWQEGWQQVPDFI